MRDPLAERKDAFTWLITAGTVAVLFSLFLVQVDYFLKDSDRESRVYFELRELRTAQTTVGSGIEDDRSVSNSTRREFLPPLPDVSAHH